MENRFKILKIAISLALVASLSGITSCAMEPKKSSATTTGTLKMKLAPVAGQKSSGAKAGASQALIPKGSGAFMIRYLLFPEGKYSLYYMDPNFIDPTLAITDANYPADEHGAILAQGMAFYDDVADMSFGLIAIEGIEPRTRYRALIHIYNPTALYFYNEWDTSGVITYIDEQYINEFSVAYVGTISAPFDIVAGQATTVELGSIMTMGY
jgi:hypothetical protein